MTDQEGDLNKSNDAPSLDHKPDDDGEIMDQWEILADAVGRLLNEPGITKAIAEVIIATAKRKSMEPTFIRTSHVLGLSFSFLIFIGIGVLGYLKVIGPEATTGLLGALIGYWWGREKAGSNQ